MKPKNSKSHLVKSIQKNEIFTKHAKQTSATKLCIEVIRLD